MEAPRLQSTWQRRKKDKNPSLITVNRAHSVPPSSDLILNLTNFENDWSEQKAQDE